MTIDWTSFDKYPESTCECRCGAVFRSHAKSQMSASPPRLVSRKPCPACGGDTLVRISSDPETMTLGSSSVKKVER